MDWDVLKTTRETIDWLITKYKEGDDYSKKKKLNKIATQISILVVNKIEYISILKRELKSNKEYVDLAKIHSALSIAEKDTTRLNELCKELSLEALDVSFSFKHGLEKLTRSKEIKLSELRELVSTGLISNKDTEDVILELENFEQKWVDLGKEIDQLVKGI